MKQKDAINKSPISPMGGTEILLGDLKREVPAAILDQYNIILSNASLDQIEKGKRNILWNHLSYDQPNIKNIADKNYQKNIDANIFVSHWQYEKFRYIYDIPTEKCFVIKNAITPVTEQTRRRTKKVTLAYTSTPWRGLDVLLDAMEILNDNEVELHVYSSTEIYGAQFHAENKHKFEALWARAHNLPYVTLHGYRANSEVREALLGTDIFAYPSTFEETSCLAAIEAASAGCQMLVTNFGALYETLSEWPTYINITYDKHLLACRFAEAIKGAIQGIRSQSNGQFRESQRAFFRKFWTWDTRRSEWISLLKQL